MDVPFVGRRRELDEMARHLAGSAAGLGALVWVLGEAGIGKSALLRQFRSCVVPLGVPVLSGRAVRDLGAPAFWPWLRAFSSAAAEGCGLSAELLSTTAQMYGSPAAARFGSLVRASGQLLAAAETAGMVVIVEDLQWADEGTLQMLDHVGSEISDSRLLLVASAREFPATQLNPPGTGSVIRLGPLTPAEVATYLGGGTHPSWPAVVHHRTGGNPLYLTEVVRLLEPGDLRAPADGSWPVPSQLSRVVSKRLSQLSVSCRRFLDGAAVAGEEFDLDLLNPDPDPEPEAVAEAVAAGLLLEDVATPGRLRWSHAVVREVCYEQLSRSHRIAWHRRVAERLDGRGSEYAGELARHRLRCAVDERSRQQAVVACAAAAEVASVASDFASAGQWYARTLPLVRSDAARAETLLQIARASYRAGQVVEALERCQDAAEAAEMLGRVDLLVEAAVTVRGVGGLAPGAIVAMCERARAVLGTEQSARHARVLAQHATALADAQNVAAAQPLSEDAMAMATHSGDGDALMEAMHARHEVIGGLDGVAERLSLGARMIEAASASGRPEAALWGHVWRVDAEWQLGNVNELLAELFDLAALVNRIGWPLARWHLLRAQATRAIQTGRFDEAARLAMQCQEVAARTQDIAAQVQSHLVMSELHTLTGRHGEPFSKTALNWEAAADAKWLPVSYATFGWHEFQAGNHDNARRMFDQVRPMLGSLPVNARWMATMTRSGELAALLGDVETAAVTYRLLIPYGEFFAGQSAAYLGAIPRVLGVLASVLGDHEAADAHGAEAVLMERRVGALPFAALAQLAHARSLLARGRFRDRAHASALLEDCLVTAHRLAMRPTVAAASTLLGEVSGRSPGRGTLTAREREIAALVADGMSNREIADQLVLSERTIETHLHNILAKLGLMNRTQVAGWGLHVGIGGKGTWLH